VKNLFEIDHVFGCWKKFIFFWGSIFSISHSTQCPSSLETKIVCCLTNNNQGILNFVILKNWKNWKKVPKKKSQFICQKT
jgi:hypothetical protein